MVRDGSSGNDNLPPEAAGSAQDFGGHGPQDLPTNNLTHELAQLLAATIAQSQTAQGHQARNQTGSELTNLARLVAATSAQRTLAPVFKDGLSALSYTPSPLKPVPQSSTGPAELSHEHDDEPMPIPSTWREPASHDEDGWVRQQMGAAALGLVAGLMIVVPSVLWLSGWLGGPQKTKPGSESQVASTSGDVRQGEVKTVKVQVRPVDKPVEAAAATQYVATSAEARPPIELRAAPVQTASVAAPVNVPAPRSRSDDFVDQANRRIESGDVVGARELLTGIEDGTPGQGSVWFVLAETYDPNMLAAWGTRGVTADVARAKALYGKALAGGVPRAKGRLDALR